jgi:hypothetical protein
MAIPRNFTIKEQLKQNLGALTEKVLFTENPSIFTGRNKKNKLMEYKVLTPNTIEVTELIEEPITNKILTLKDVTDEYTETYKWDGTNFDNQLAIPVTYNHEYLSSGGIRTASIPISTISNRSSGRSGTVSIGNEITMSVNSWSFEPIGIDPAQESSTTSTLISTTDIPSTPSLNTSIAYGNATINFNMSATETRRSTYHFRETIDRICNQLSEETEQQIFGAFSRAIGIPAPIIKASDRLAAIKFISSIEHAKLKSRLLMLI